MTVQEEIEKIADLVAGEYHEENEYRKMVVGLITKVYNLGVAESEVLVRALEKYEGASDSLYDEQGLRVDFKLSGIPFTEVAKSALNEFKEKGFYG